MDGSEVIEIISSTLIASVNTNGTIGTISGDLILGKSPNRDLEVFFQPNQFFKIT